MAIVQLEDLSGSCEAVVFPKTYLRLSEYLLTATWLTYLKSKLLLPETDDEEFKAHEVAEKLKLQLKKLELIRLLSDQMLKRERLGKDVFMRGIKGSIKSISTPKQALNLIMAPRF